MKAVLALLIIAVIVTVALLIWFGERGDDGDEM